MCVTINAAFHKEAAASSAVTEPVGKKRAQMEPLSENNQMWKKLNNNSDTETRTKPSGDLSKAPPSNTDTLGM